jgi:hypothetical protein
MIVILGYDVAEIRYTRFRAPVRDGPSAQTTTFGPMPFGTLCRHRKDAEQQRLNAFDQNASSRD